MVMGSAEGDKEERASVCVGWEGGGGVMSSRPEQRLWENTENSPAVTHDCH